MSGTLIYIVDSHLKALNGSQNEQIREREQEGIINHMDNLGNVPIAYLGDLNSFSPEDWGVTYPGKYHSRIDFIYVNQFLSSYIINSTTGDTTHAMAGSDHLTVDVFINLNLI